MPISGLQNSYLQTDLLGSSAFISSADKQDPLDGALYNLTASIHSGNLSHAQKYLEEVKQMTSSTADSGSPFSLFLADISKALSVGSISDAQTTLTALGDHLTRNQAGSETPTEPEAPSLSNNQSIGKGVLGLITAINTGDLSNVQQAYSQLSTQLTPLGNSHASGYSSIRELLQGVGTALSSSNVRAAQQAMNRFLDDSSSGLLVSATA
jgi:hypothetical protein